MLVLRRFAAVALLLMSGTGLAQDLLLLEDPQEAFKTRFALIEAENKSIRLSTYILKDDLVSVQFLESLVRAARRGVDVKLLVDGQGSKEAFSPKQLELLEALKASGGDIRIFHPMGATNLVLRPFNFARRMHDKLLIGSEVMFVGDRNIADEYFGLGEYGERNFFSSEVLVGKEDTVRTSTQYFDKLFDSDHVESYLPTIGERSSELSLPTADRAQATAFMKNQTHRFKKADIRFLHDPRDEFVRGKIPVPHKDSNYNRLLKMIKDSKSSIEIVNSYVFLEKEIFDALKDAVKRGVKVEILTNSYKTSDVKLVANIFATQVPLIKKAGISILEFQGEESLHSKLMLVDGSKAYVGSFNLDPRSRALNTETGVYITNAPEFIADLRGHMDKAKAQSGVWKGRTRVFTEKCSLLLIKLFRPILSEQI